MIETSPESLTAAVATLLPVDPPPGEADIDATLHQMAAAFGATEEVVQEARRRLHARFAIRMDLGETLIGTDEHEPWLNARRASIDPFYWTRYRELLIRSGWSPLVASTLDRATDKLLELLGDPKSLTEWNRRGLVVGDVQSGKTASYAALICKAADAGYRMIILLTGTLENVRRQTQERLDAAFVGFDSRDSLGDTSIIRKRLIGAGLIDGRRNGIVFTSRDQDFKKNSITLSLESVREPVLVVSKKNKAVLKRLAAWLRARNADREGKIDLPLLLIDDEADNASINTRLEPNETTAINSSIRDLLRLFRRSSYVGFTATPFANIFVDPASTDEMLGDDLFPKDFIHVLEPPTNYVGMATLFPRSDPEDSATDFDASEAFVRTIDDADQWVAPDHKKEAEPEGLPPSLLNGLRCFLLANAIRDLRDGAGEPGRGGGIHRSMLVNVSRFTAVQNRVAALLHVQLDDIRREVRLHGAMPAFKASQQSPEIAALEAAFRAEYADSGRTWPEVLSSIHNAIASVKVQPVNQGTGAASLDYSVMDTPPGLRVIAVGGNSLSRGLTLEGLSTSYFLRNAKAYDTLLQMGRWFGYRDGYADLCRLWLTEEADGWYRHVTEATAELKRDFVRMERRKATPREFGLRVRTHPDTLIITARNKMATGVDVVGERDISFMGRMIETSRLYSDRARNEENTRIIDDFIGCLVRQAGVPVDSPHGGALLWSGIGAGVVADFLDAFLVHPLNFDFQGDMIAGFLRESALAADSPLSRWTVALLTSGTRGEMQFSNLPDVVLEKKKRQVRYNRKDGSLLVSGKSARVGSNRDVRHGLSLRRAEQVIEADRTDHPDHRQVPEDAFRSAMTSPLLIIYLLSGVERVTADGRVEERSFRDGMLLPALGLHFPGTKDPDAPKHLIRYRLNVVAQAELLPPDMDDEGDMADADADD